jgi:hypothetical protein
MDQMATEKENSANQDLVESLWSGFLTRCRVCIDLRGGSVNGDWGKVHRIHHQFDPINPPAASTSVKE